MTDIQVAGFTRQEVMHLTGCTSSRLAYLEKAGLIVPKRIGIGRQPVVLFSWNQVVLIVAIKDLRKSISPSNTRKIAQFLNQDSYLRSRPGEFLVLLNDEAFWVQQGTGELQEKIESIAYGKNAVQIELFVLPSFDEIVDQLWAAAKDSLLIDFESFKERAS